MRACGFVLIKTEHELDVYVDASNCIILISNVCICLHLPHYSSETPAIPRPSPPSTCFALSFCCTFLLSSRCTAVLLFCCSVLTLLDSNFLQHFFSEFGDLRHQSHCLNCNWAFLHSQNHLKAVTGADWAGALVYAEQITPEIANTNWMKCAAQICSVWVTIVQRDRNTYKWQNYIYKNTFVLIHRDLHLKPVLYNHSLTCWPLSSSTLEAVIRVLL